MTIKNTPESIISNSTQLTYLHAAKRHHLASVWEANSLAAREVVKLVREKIDYSVRNDDVIAGIGGNDERNES